MITFASQKNHNNMATVTIIGIGQMGSALAFVAAHNGNQIRMVGSPVDDAVVEACIRDGKHPKMDIPYPKGIQYYYCKDWEKAVEGTDFVIGAISSFGVEWFLEDILKSLAPSVIVLSLAKGLVELPGGKLVSYPDYWVRELRKCGIRRNIYALGGPGTADGIIRKDHTHVVICGKDSSILKMMKESLQTPWFHISITKDARGLETAVAIKNAYALGIAMALGYARKLHGNQEEAFYNSQACVFYQAIKEMIRILDMQGANFDSTLIGIGDLYVTATGARTRKLGLLLGEGKTCEEAQEILGGMTLESLVVIRRLAQSITERARKGQVNLNDFPLLQFVIGVLDSGTMTDLPWDKFTFVTL